MHIVNMRGSGLAANAVAAWAVADGPGVLLTGWLRGRWLPGVAEGLPPGLNGRVGLFERAHGLPVVALRDGDEQAVDHGQCRDPAGHGARPERGLARRGRQHVVGYRSDPRAGEVRDGHRD